MNNYYTISSSPNVNGINYNSWQPEATTNNQIQKNAQLVSNWKYRQYLQKNANNIMKYNTMESLENSGNNPYSLFNTDTTNNNPYLYNSIHDTNNPAYGIHDSDLKDDYLTRERRKARMVAPSIPTNF